MIVLACRVASMIVNKIDASSFRDVELADVIRVYCTCIGWKPQDNPRKDGTGVTVCCLDFYDTHGRRGFTFSGGIAGTEQNKTKQK